MKHFNLLNSFRWFTTVILLVTFSVGNVWGTVDATYTLSTSDNNKSNISVGSTTWAVGASAIEASSANCKITGTISVTLPTGAVLKSVTLTKSNNWGSGAKVIFKAGSTSLNEFTAEGTFTLTSNKTNGLYSFTKGGTASKNAWVKSIKVTYYPQTAITLNANGGAANKTAKYNYNSGTKAAFEACTRDGYTCTGYWTASSGGTKILNTDGTLAAASITVSSVPYTDSNTKWAYDGATLTLYAQWTANAACDANPSVGNASLNGSFNMTSTTSSIGVSSGTCSTGNAACDWTDYGFVWSDGANTTTPTVGGTNCNKVKVGESGTGTSWTGSITPSGSTTPTSWTTGHTYYVRTYGKNSNASASYYYSETALTFTPRSVTFNLNGHGSSTPTTQYVNNGDLATDPSYSESVTGYAFGGWYNNADWTQGTQWNFGTSTVSGENKTLYARWTANEYTITLNQDLTPTSAGTTSITATYNSNSNLADAIDTPTKTGWTFAGYFTAKNGGGTQIIDASGNVIASVEGYTDSNKKWIKAGGVTLYAKWTCTVTWSVNNLTNVYSAQTLTYNASSTKVASVPGPPSPATYCGDKFVGWTDAAIDGSQNSEPSTLFTDVAGSPELKTVGNITFYAVFADYDDED